MTPDPIKTLLAIAYFLVFAIVGPGCDSSTDHPITGPWLEEDTTRYERDPLRVGNGAYYQIDRHTVSFRADGNLYDTYQLEGLTWQYIGTWTADGEMQGTVTTADDRGMMTRSYVLDGDVLVLDGIRYLRLNEGGLQ